jgi:ethanolamine utilization protein EutP (predicted NTPase)
VVVLAAKGGPLFEVTVSAYRTGLIDKGMALLGDALDEVMRQTGCEIGDLVNKLDMATEKAVMQVDTLLAHSGPMLKLAANDRLNSLASRMLDVAAVRKLGVIMLTKILARVVTAA